MDKAEKKNNMALFLKANSLKQKRSKKWIDMSEMQSMLETLENKKKMQQYILFSVLFYVVLLDPDAFRLQYL